jgi:hypothetical protein
MCIINRLPTTTLQHTSPYEKLYKKSPDYQCLRVFGCLCYPLLRPYGLHRLEYISKPCIFLGYQYVEYNCLEPITNKAYLSRHVVFYETSFPAMDHVASLLPSQLATTSDSTFSFPILSSPLSLAIAAPSAPFPTADSL